MTADVDAFLDQFFGRGNELNPATMSSQSPDLAAWLNDRLSDLRAEPTGTHLLPRRWRGVTTWYALAHSRRQAQALSQELQAFIGASYAKVERPTPLDRRDEVEAAVLAFTGGHGFSVPVVPSSQAAVRSALDLLASLRRTRPLRTEVGPKPLGRLLRDFEMAVVAGDDRLASLSLDAIEKSGLLNTQNILFLRVRRLAGFGRYGDVTTMPEFAPLLAIRRPTRVTADLVAAVYEIELREFEVRGDAPGAIEHFSSEVLRRFPALFRSRQGIVTPAAVKAFAIHLVATGPYESASLQAMLDCPDLSRAEHDWIAEVARHGIPAEQHGDSIDSAMAAMREGRFDDGLRIALSLPVDREQAELVLRCAVEIGSLDAARSAVYAVSQLDEASQADIEQSRWLGAAWIDVRSKALAGGHHADVENDLAPESWAELLERVAAGDLPAATALAERAVVEWSIVSLTEGEIARVSSAISSASSETRGQVSEVLPYLLQFLDRAEDQRSHRPLLEDIALLLLSEDTIRVPELHVLVGLLANLIETSTDVDWYRQVIDDFLALWARTEAPSHLDAALEFLDSLVAAPAPSVDARMLVLQAVLASFQRWRRRVREDQWDLLDDLSDELGVSDATNAFRPSTSLDEDSGSRVGQPRASLDGRLIAIYTLTETAGQRAAAFFERHFNNVRVELTHDHVASDRLRYLAGSADLFVVATRSAKHAATTYIQANRPARLPTLFPSGKGSASIIRSVYAHIAAET